MKKKSILYVIALLMLVYPVFSLFNAIEAIGTLTVKEAEQAVVSYEMGVWITWSVLVAIAIFYKWTRGSNFFFFFSYGFILIGFGIIGYLSQSIINTFNLPSHFEDSYTLGVLIAFQKIVSAIILTVFLQAAVWWFTRKWYRR